MEVTYKVKNKLSLANNVINRNLLERNESIGLYKDLYSTVHNSIIHSSPNNSNNH